MKFNFTSKYPILYPQKMKIKLYLTANEIILFTQINQQALIVFTINAINL